MRTARTMATIGSLGLILSAVLACNRQQAEPYAPGLGEIMTLQQMRHTKLWLAGEAGNWELAEYELDELEEGFDDVIAYHPTHEGSPVPLDEAIPRMVDKPLEDLRAAVERRDPTEFVQAFDALTAACNNCHQATDFGFNVVGRPGGNPFPNQIFERQR